MATSLLHQQPLCAASDVPDGTARGFAALGIFVLRHAGRLHGFRDACPHDGRTPLPWRRDAYFNAGRTRLVCAAHGAQFEPDTGLCVLGPCLGQRLTRVPLTLAGDGSIVLDHPPKEPTP